MKMEIENLNLNFSNQTLKNKITNNKIFLMIIISQELNMKNFY